ncbi:unnamed protein product [Cyprideis torosa]|uniref:E3 ubiquitin-protein ligase Hakai n=1 Tax=Cyprideis torosa TaxID=163714 RepID=A0A7R8WGS6_9CRUS|nr:unnamed protein product [Cyprideis torosa]CAG0898488.1 unnamed protein product [Cyprideis torosa]
MVIADCDSTVDNGPTIRNDTCFSNHVEVDAVRFGVPAFSVERLPLPLLSSLEWDHVANLIGQKVQNPLIHCCDDCRRPIVIYGRMIPCKHVFCLNCADDAFKENKGHCPRCRDRVDRVEQSGLGQIFMCTNGGTRHGTKGCRRTYMSSRDLQAHINHRHKQRTPAQPKVEPSPVSMESQTPVSTHSLVSQVMSQEASNAIVTLTTSLINTLTSANLKTVHSHPSPVTTTIKQEPTHLTVLSPPHPPPPLPPAPVPPPPPPASSATTFPTAPPPIPPPPFVPVPPPAPTPATPFFNPWVPPPSTTFQQTSVPPPTHSLNHAPPPLLPPRAHYYP